MTKLYRRFSDLVFVKEYLMIRRFCSLVMRSHWEFRKKSNRRLKSEQICQTTERAKKCHKNSEKSNDTLLFLLDYGNTCSTLIFCLLNASTVHSCVNPNSKLFSEIYTTKRRSSQTTNCRKKGFMSKFLIEE